MKITDQNYYSCKRDLNQSLFTMLFWQKIYFPDFSLTCFSKLLRFSLTFYKIHSFSPGPIKMLLFFPDGGNPANISEKRKAVRLCDNVAKK